jgi:hypothetical protein
MDTNIGVLNLTRNQINNASVLDLPAPFLGCSYHADGSVVVVSESVPTQQEIDGIVSFLNGQPDSPSQKVLENSFDINLMLGAMGLAFTGVDAVTLAPYLSAIQNYASAPFRNFKGIKDFIAGLVALGKATQAQADTLTAIFAQQGILLSNY